MGISLQELVVVFGILLAGIALVVWVYRDAGRRGMNAPFWAAIVFFMHVLGLVAYLAARTSARYRTE